jgi:DNA adenine methylase
MNYPGGKNGGGAYQHIINLIPPHSVYIEAFAGSAAVYRHLKPCSRSILIEKDTTAVQSLFPAVDGRNETTIYNDDAFLLLPEWSQCEDVFIYCDPPYLPETRVKKKLYEHEMTFSQHVELLEILCSAGSRVAISGYPSALYENYLFGWNTFEYDAMTRGGTMRRECIWYNYPTPTKLHDYRYLGRNRTERQRIRRKIHRWKTKLSTLPEVERNAIVAGIQQTGASTAATADKGGYVS